MLETAICRRWQGTKFSVLILIHRASALNLSVSWNTDFQLSIFYSLCGVFVCMFWAAEEERRRTVICQDWIWSNPHARGYALLTFSIWSLPDAAALFIKVALPLGLLYMLKNCPDRRTDVCSSTCECMSPFHKLPSLCSLRFVLTCRPGLKLIRILSEENLKERIALSQSCPFIWCQEIHFHVWTAHTATEADSVAQRLCLHCPPTASSPLLL